MGMTSPQERTLQCRNPRISPQLVSMVYGQAVGDALGVPHEFQDRDGFTCTGMDSGGVHGQPAGTWSDDTSLMLASVDSLAANGWKLNAEDMRSGFRSWLRHGKYAVDGMVFDCGNTVRTALRHI
ncbi:ADP-ribosylglycohydrolase family protein [Bifidobacterium catulorum]|nr:ADP-ribosylglycohydrolase family protein [Bifidobacterium catulorum]